MTRPRPTKAQAFDKINASPKAARILVVVTESTFVNLLPRRRGNRDAAD